jgi:hypothetical protein
LKQDVFRLQVSVHEARNKVISQLHAACHTPREKNHDRDRKDRSLKEITKVNDSVFTPQESRHREDRHPVDAENLTVDKTWERSELHSEHAFTEKGTTAHRVIQQLFRENFAGKRNRGNMPSRIGILKAEVHLAVAAVLYVEHIEARAQPPNYLDFTGSSSCPPAERG